ncbi:hypothetical protein [Clostridium tertium]|uniref:hypothetical protein n=1 Tax=Clostridium tertium TaxID=1559 RepID=UPI0023B21BFC|nr:hypothetical protein [Clostridium tertium]
MVTTIIQVGTAAVASAILEKVLTACNRMDLAEWVKIAGVALVGVVVVAKLVELLVGLSAGLAGI